VVVDDNLRTNPVFTITDDEPTPTNSTVTPNDDAPNTTTASSSIEVSGGAKSVGGGDCGGGDCGGDCGESSIVGDGPPVYRTLFPKGRSNVLSTSSRNDLLPSYEDFTKK